MSTYLIKDLCPSIIASIRACVKDTRTKHNIGKDKTGKLLVISVQDETGTIDIIAYNNLNSFDSWCSDIKLGEWYKFDGPIQVNAHSDKLELKLNYQSSINKIAPVADLKLLPDMKSISEVCTLEDKVETAIKGVVVRCDKKASQIKEGTRKRSLLVCDKSGTIECTLWSNSSNSSDTQFSQMYEEGSIVSVKKARVSYFHPSSNNKAPSIDVNSIEKTEDSTLSTWYESDKKPLSEMQSLSGNKNKRVNIIELKDMNTSSEEKKHVDVVGILIECDLSPKAMNNGLRQMSFKLMDRTGIVKGVAYDQRCESLTGAQIGNLCTITTAEVGNKFKHIIAKSWSILDVSESNDPIISWYNDLKSPDYPPYISYEVKPPSLDCFSSGQRVSSIVKIKQEDNLFYVQDETAKIKIVNENTSIFTNDSIIYIKNAEYKEDGILIYNDNFGSLSDQDPEVIKSKEASLSKL